MYIYENCKLVGCVFISNEMNRLIKDKKKSFDFERSSDFVIILYSFLWNTNDNKIKYTYSKYFEISNI